MGGSTPKEQVTTTKQQQATSGTTSGTESASTAGGGTSQQASGQFGQQDVQIPDWLKNFIGSSTGTAGTALSTASGLAGGYQIPPEALKALTDTAGGNFLYGGPGQQPFIDAAVRGASPGIFSQFGAAGGGGGGLQKAALDQAAVDAYAKLYGSERQNQLSAATALPGITQMPFNMQTQLAQLAGGLPGQFSPFLGQMTSGGQFGTGATSQYGTTQSATSGQTSGTSNTLGTQSQPIYQTPWWQTALGVGTSLAGLALPGFGGISALGALTGATPALAAGATQASPGLLGFR